MEELTGERRRVTRQSTRRVTVDDSSNAPSPSTPATTNPYKKPVYTPSSETTPRGRGGGSKTTTVKSTRGNGNGRGRGSKSNTPAAAGAGATTPTASTSSGGRGGSRGGKRGRPECISSSRTPSKSKKSKKRKKSYYNTTDYHYGSDFDESEEHDDFDDEELEEDEEEDEDDQELDLSPDPDLDEELEEDGTSTIIPQFEPPPIFYNEVEPTEKLILPKSSEDLMIDKQYVIQALAVYEPLRRFSGLVRLTQFRFEEFCAALAATEEQSVLLMEIHVQLLKALLREDDVTNTSYGPPEVKDSVQSILYFIDSITWPEVLRSYLDSDPINWSSTHALIKSVDYPFCTVEIRLEILSWLVNQFLTTSPVRDALASEIIKHEDHCRSCTKLGELICCESCPAVYHLECIDPPLKREENGEYVPDEWKCIVCKRDELTGTADCVSELEKAGLLIRQEKLGYDRHGRKYWFLARRIVVEADDDCWYYTTTKQFAELMYCLEGEHYEEHLLQTLRYHADEIERQMEITEELTSKAGQHRRTWLDIENSALDKLNEERALIIEQEKAERVRELEAEAARVAAIEAERLRAEEEVKKREEDEKRRIREERLAKRNTEKAKAFEEQDMAIINDLIRETAAGEEGESSKSPDDDSPPTLTKEEDSPVNNDKGEDSTQETPALDKEESDKKDTAMEVDAEQASKNDNADEKKEEEPDKEDETPMEQESGSPSSSIATTSEKDSNPPEPTPEDSAPKQPLKKPPVKTTLTTLLSTEVDRITRLKSAPPFKLGADHRNYTNSYSSDPLALSKAQHQEERDRKRYTSHKFSLTTASEFKWFGNCNGTKANLASSIKGTLLTLEALLPTTLLHINWAGLRKGWVIRVQTGGDLKEGLMELVDCLRPCLYNSVWFEGAGHLRLVRMSGIEKEERKKMEKFEKKWKDDEEDRFKLQGVVKYTIPLKHQVFKQKGEEYRIHGQYGWIWRSAIRPARPTPSTRLGLRAGPQKYIIQVKGEDAVVKTMLIDPNVYNKLMAKREPAEPPGIRYDRVKLHDGRVVGWTEYLSGEYLIQDNNTDDDENESDEGKAENELEEGEEEETDEVQKEVKLVMKELLKSVEEICADKKPKLPKVETIKEDAKQQQQQQQQTEIINVSKGLVLANRVSFPKLAHKVAVCDTLLGRRMRLQVAEEKVLAAKYGEEINNTGGIITSCYCVYCDSSCYALRCPKEENNLKLEIEAARVYTTRNTSLAVYLKKNEANPTRKINLGSTLPKLTSTFKTSKGKSILVLPSWELKRLARSSGRSYVPLGFNATKTWGGYPCGRPNFKTAWSWRSVTGGWSLSSMALQLRILWACIRWDDLNTKPPVEGKSQITTDTEVITNEILDHRIIGRFMEKMQYLRKRHIVPIDPSPAMKTVIVKDVDLTPSRHGLRKRKRLATPTEADPTILEEWVDEDKLELWEIRYYGERKLNEKNTRLKSGISLNKPDKYDPSVNNTPTARQDSPRAKETSTPQHREAPVREVHGKKLDPVLIADQIDSKVAHISKRDNHAKTASVPVRVEPTASELLQMQQTVTQKLFCSSTTATTFGTGLGASVVGRKFFINKAKESMKAAAAAARVPTPTNQPGISPAPRVIQNPRPTLQTPSQSPRTPIQPPSVSTTPTNINLTHSASGQTTRLQVFKGEDGKLQIRGLLPGQHCYQTADGRIHIVGTPVSTPSTPSPALPSVSSSTNNPTNPVKTYAATNPGRIIRNPTSSTGQTQVIVTSGVPTPGNPTPTRVPVQPNQTTTPLVSVQPNQTPTSVSVQQTLPIQQNQAILVTTSTSQPNQIQPTTGVRTPQILTPRRPRAPLLRAQPNQLPISIVSPSKQQKQQGQSQQQQPQQQTPTYQLITTPDGKQFLARHQLPLVRRVLQTGGPQQQQQQQQRFLIRQPMVGSTVTTTTAANLQQITETLEQQQQQHIIRTSSGLQVVRPQQLSGQPGRILLRAGQQPILVRSSGGQFTPIRFLQSPPPLIVRGTGQPQVQIIQQTVQVQGTSQQQQTQGVPQLTQPKQVVVQVTQSQPQQIAIQPQQQVAQITQQQSTQQMIQQPRITQTGSQQPRGPVIMKQFVTAEQLAALQKQGLIRGAPQPFIIRDGQPPLPLIRAQQQQQLIPQQKVQLQQVIPQQVQHTKEQVQLQAQQVSLQSAVPMQTLTQHQHVSMQSVMPQQQQTLTQYISMQPEISNQQQTAQQVNIQPQPATTSQLPSSAFPQQVSRQQFPVTTQPIAVKSSPQQPPQQPPRIPSPIIPGLSIPVSSSVTVKSEIKSPRSISPVKSAVKSPSVAGIPGMTSPKPTFMPQPSPPRLMTPPPVIPGLSLPVASSPSPTKTTTKSLSPTKSLSLSPSMSNVPFLGFTSASAMALSTSTSTIMTTPPHSSTVVKTELNTPPMPSTAMTMTSMNPSSTSPIMTKSSPPTIPLINTTVPSPVKPAVASPTKSLAPVVQPPLPPPPPITLAPLSPQQLQQKSNRRKTSHVTQPQRSPEPTLSPQQKALLFNHKEALKQDIFKKRALLENQLRIDIQREMEEKAAAAKKRRSDAAIADSPPKSRRQSATTNQQDKISCLCGQPITGTQFYVGCSGCNEFFHGSCVGITKTMLNQGKVYTCERCEPKEVEVETEVVGAEVEVEAEIPEPEPEPSPPPVKRKAGRKKSGKSEEIFCLCKQPYDDSHFYICCDACQDWFHGRCVGVLPIEGQSIVSYKCPKCCPKAPVNIANFKVLSKKHQDYLRTFMQQVLELEEADDFYDEVDPKLHPTYRKIIREPMDLKTMEQRVTQGLYSHLSDFIADACRIFDNCNHYNTSSSPIVKKAASLEAFFLQKLRLIRQMLLSGKD